MQRKKWRLNIDWRFCRSDVPGAEAEHYDDSAWAKITIPHTLELCSLELNGCPDDKMQESFQREVAWYRRKLQTTPNRQEAQSNQRVFLEFEGAQQVTDLWINGIHVGQHAIGGYTPFSFDITDYLHPSGENCLALRLDNRVNPDIPPDPGPYDYVKFSGLYRDVYQVETAGVYIPFPWEAASSGVEIRTPVVKPEGSTVTVRTTVRNTHQEPQLCHVLTRVIDAEGYVVLKLESPQIEIDGGREHRFSQVAVIERGLRLWSCDDPYLYRVHSLVFVNDEAVDNLENPLGFRRFELRENEGFLLNGKALMLIGVNRHQHYPYIGDALPASLHYKDALQFKQFGFNVVRLAHYPHNDAFIRACDELGILVYEEAPTWINFGSEAWTKTLEEALRRTIRNHRNHPCIFAWGAGINHRGPLEPLHCAAKEEDPDRWTASNHSPWTGTQRAGICDFQSNMDYRDLEEPQEMFFAAEHGVSADGKRAQEMVSRYKGSPRRFGMAAWTAHAYYTFHTRAEGQLNRTRGGMMDVFRQPRPVCYWYQSELTDEPMVYIASDWREDLRELCVFSNCEEVEVLVNQVSLGRRKAERTQKNKHLRSPPFYFAVVWQTGEVIARAWQNGEIKAEQRLCSPQQAYAIHLHADLEQRSLCADGSDILGVFASVCDAYGTLIKDFEGEITFRLEGPAEIIGGPEIGANPVRCIDGVGQVLLHASSEPGPIRLYAESSNLQAANLSFSSVPAPKGPIPIERGPIYDLAQLRLDLGGKDQHVLYGWRPWYESDDAEITVPELGPKAKLCLHTEASEATGTLCWRGESNVPGPLGYMAEDGVCAEHALLLDLVDLPRGYYRITTYHHAPESDTDSMDPLKDKTYNANLLLIPAAIYLDIFIASQKVRSYVEQTQGKKLKSTGPGKTSFTVFIDEDLNDSRMQLRIIPSNEQGTVWLNGLEIQRIIKD